MDYESLNDAACHEKGLQTGPTRILFWTDLCVFKFMAGELPKMEDLERTHVELGSVLETDKSDIFRALQAENWSPKGEAKNLVYDLGTHASMTIGDIIVTGDEYWVVTPTKFHLIGTSPQKKKRKKRAKK